MSLKTIVELSQSYGSDSRFVLAGGGNTSYKDDNFLYVKPSGVRLANICESDFVKMNRADIRKCFELKDFANREEREAIVKKMMAFAVCPESTGRPSVEAPLHEILPTTYVVHLHPAMVNGMTCGKDGKAKCAELFPESLWIDYIDPGFVLAKTVFDANNQYKEKYGKDASVIFLQNHGVFVGGNTEEEIRATYDKIMGTLTDYYASKGVSTEVSFGELDNATVQENAPALRTMLGDGTPVAVTCLPPFEVAKGPLTPDHIVYAKSFAFIADEICGDCVNAFKETRGYKPMVVAVPGKAVFCSGTAYCDAINVAALAKDGSLVQQLTEAFGGVNYMSDAARGFIENWEVESYRKKVAAGSGGGSLNGKIAVVTGGAQGFGFGIAEELVANGATVAIADLNEDGAQAAADKLNAGSAKIRSIALAVNIGNEESVQAMMEKLVTMCGGCDLFVANAGVLRAGSVKSLEKKDWDFVTDINYSGYFLCAKHAAIVMAKQNAGGDNWTDIVQVNSKSGLTGSNRNGAYAGSKFGTIGLTQSFAMELVGDKIKVNSVCPGNFFDGPLWSDPDRGLFVQYLNSGKVPGAKTVEDVKKFYEAKIPMNRGCFPKDVAKAIMYAVGQKYETGQAIPVTGGQVMLN